MEIENSRLKRAIIPIAGLGTRLLPFSKVIPKAMLPVHDRPCVQWIVEELVNAGITDIIFVTSKGQDMVKEYFNEKTWYDDELHKRNKSHHAEHLEGVRNLANFHFVDQPEQLGDGHAILQARPLIGEDEPVLVVFGDCLYHGDEVVTKLREHYDAHGKSIIAVQEIHPHETHQYGIVAHKEGHDYIVDAMVEKPTPEEAPSNKAVIGRYVLSPPVWKHLEQSHAGSGEARLIDALQALHDEEEVHALLMEGHWLDTGTLEGLHKAAEKLKNRE